MRLFKFLSVLVFAVMCSMYFSETTSANPYIIYHIERIRLNNQGEVRIDGYFENTGDTDAYVKWLEFDLILTADNGQEMWSDYGIFHEMDLFIPAYGFEEYTFYIQNPDIPEYRGRFNWQFQNCRINWDLNAG